MRLLTLSILVFGSSVPGQTAKYDYVDQKLPYANPNPAMLTALSLPKIGTTLRLQVPYSWRQRNRVGKDYVLATGLTNPNVPIAALGGYLYTSAQVIVTMPMSPLGIPGTTTIDIPVPNSVLLLGIAFHQQILESTALAPIQRRLSRGGHGVIGR